MAAEEDRLFRTAFRQLRREFPAKARQSFLDDVEGQLSEDEDIWECVSKPKTKVRYVCVTFDRHTNDGNSSYQYADFTLVLLDRIVGGNGIYKPANQVRALQWNAKRSDLLRILRYLANNNSNIKFNRILIMPFPIPPIGVRIDRKIHLK